MTRCQSCSGNGHYRKSIGGGATIKNWKCEECGGRGYLRDESQIYIDDKVLLPVTLFSGGPDDFQVSESNMSGIVKEVIEGGIIAVEWETGELRPVKISSVKKVINP